MEIKCSHEERKTKDFSLMKDYLIPTYLYNPFSRGSTEPEDDSLTFIGPDGDPVCVHFSSTIFSFGLGFPNNISEIMAKLPENSHKYRLEVGLEFLSRAFCYNCILNEGNIMDYISFLKDLDVDCEEFFVSRKMYPTVPRSVAVDAQKNNSILCYYHCADIPYRDLSKFRCGYYLPTFGGYYEPKPERFYKMEIYNDNPDEWCRLLCDSDRGVYIESNDKTTNLVSKEYKESRDRVYKITGPEPQNIEEMRECFMYFIREMNGTRELSHSLWEGLYREPIYYIPMPQGKYIDTLSEPSIHTRREGGPRSRARIEGNPFTLQILSFDIKGMRKAWKMLRLKRNRVKWGFNCGFPWFFFDMENSYKTPFLTARGESKYLAEMLKHFAQQNNHNQIRCAVQIDMDTCSMTDRLQASVTVAALDSLNMLFYTIYPTIDKAVNLIEAFSSSHCPPPRQELHIIELPRIYSC